MASMLAAADFTVSSASRAEVSAALISAWMESLVERSLPIVPSPRSTRAATMAMFVAADFAEEIVSLRSA